MLGGPSEARAGRETHHRVIVQRIHAVRQYVLEALPLHRKRIPIQPQDVVRIHFADRRLKTIVEGWETSVLGVAGLVDGVVARDPGVGGVVFCEFGPQPDSAVLVVFKIPERSIIRRVVGVPVWVLAAGDGVHIENCIYALFGTLRRSVSHCVLCNLRVVPGDSQDQQLGLDA